MVKLIYLLTKPSVLWIARAPFLGVVSVVLKPGHLFEETISQLFTVSGSSAFAIIHDSNHKGLKTNPALPPPPVH